MKLPVRTALNAAKDGVLYPKRPSFMLQNMVFRRERGGLWPP